MPKKAVPRGSTVVEGQDETKRAHLTRADVAERLGVSVSTVRRFEGSRLHPVISDKGVRRFKPEDVERLAAALAAEHNTPSRIEKAAVRAAELPKGELAALVFERLEQRHSLAEIVIALRVPPAEVRELYHSWLVGLWAGELQRPEPALPVRRTEQDVVRRVTREQLASMLAALPEKQPTRISLARELGEYIVPNDKDEYSTSLVEYRNLAELGGFVVSGPTSISEIARRVGAGEYRVSAYGLEVPGMRWEVFVTFNEKDAESSAPVSAKTP